MIEFCLDVMAGTDIGGLGGGLGASISEMRNIPRRIVRQTASQLSLSGFGANHVGAVTIDIGIFSRKVVELVKATDTAVSLDETQYHLCMAIRSSTDEKLKNICLRIRLQIILSFHEFTKLIEAIKIDPSPEVRKKLVEWMEYSSDLSKHAINALDPGSTSRGVRLQYSLHEIASHQNITEADMQTILALLQ
jgi:hypothetical protein